MADTVMNDPDATPASEMPDATEAEFVLLDSAPPGSDQVAGTAWIASGDPPGTARTVELAGLEPGAEYGGHLHVRRCAEDRGGPHVTFDPDGSDMPPVHIGFTADAEGDAAATVTHPAVADAAAAVVIHPVEAMDNRLVCADV